MVRFGTDKRLAHPLANGRDYVVDERAVAEAMLTRLTRGELPRSAVLVAGKPVNGLTRGVGEGGAASGPGLA
jgi:hypothetical protein